jgi:hypothetical protein
MQVWQVWYYATNNFNNYSASLSNLKFYICLIKFPQVVQQIGQYNAYLQFLIQTLKINIIQFQFLCLTIQTLNKNSCKN